MIKLIVEITRSMKYASINLPINRHKKGTVINGCILDQSESLQDKIFYLSAKINFAEMEIFLHQPKQKYE